jgi:Ca2+-binding RTX toxin-like protein
VRVLIAGALAAVALGAGADQAAANYSARVDGGTATLTGDDTGDKLAVRLFSPTILAADVGDDGTSDLLFDLNVVNAVVVNAAGGDDSVRVDQSGGALAATQLTVNGGDGADTLIGGNTAEVFDGGAGNDVVDPNIGADTVRLGAGADTFQWDPGDGSDAVEGEGGSDVVDFRASNAGEAIDLAANGPRVRLFRNVGSVTTDMDGVERLNLTMLGGADSVTVGDLTGTGLKTADVDLNGSLGSGDGAADTVTAVGTDGADAVTAGSPDGGVTISGLAAETHVTGGEAADSVDMDAHGGDDAITAGVGLQGAATVHAVGGTGADTATYTGTALADSLQVLPVADGIVATSSASAPFDTAVEDLSVQGLGGADTIAGFNGPVGATQLTLDGGSGDDVVRGTNLPETLLGGGGNDLVDGNIGADTARLGAGTDVFQWDPGDGSDTVEGEGGTDVLDFNASNAGETMDISPDGSRVRVSRNIGLVTTDIDGIEGIDLALLGSADALTVNDVTGTALKTVDVNLAGSTGVGDGAADTVTVNGTDGPDSVRVLRAGDQVQVKGLAAQTRIVGSEALFDTLRVQTLGGDDQVVTSPDVFDLITPIVDLGADD